MRYHVGDEVRLSCLFMNLERTPTDPTTVSLTVKDPSGESTTYTYADAEIVRGSAGVYYYDLLLDAAYDWQYRWVGTGTIAQADQGTIHVVPVNT